MKGPTDGGDRTEAKSAPTRGDRNAPRSDLVSHEKSLTDRETGI